MTSSKISVGSTVYGSAGVGCKVLSINGDNLTIDTSDGKGIISASRVVKVDPPQPIYSKGDLVRFIGDQDCRRWLRLDDGEILTVHIDSSIDDEWIDCRTTDMRPRQLLLAEVEPAHTILQ